MNAISDSDHTEERGLRSVTEVPGPPPAGLLGWRGNALRFFRNPVAFTMDLYRSHGAVSRLAAGGNGPIFARFAEGTSAGTVFAFGGEANQTILEDDDVFQTRSPPGPGTRAFAQLSSNLLFRNGARHKAMRSLLRPAFTRDNLKKYHGTMVRYADEMLDGWSAGSTLDLDHEMNRLALRIGSQCFYGLDPTQEGQDLALLMHSMHDDLFSPATMIRLNLPGMPYRRLVKTMERIIHGLEREIERRKGSEGEALDLMTSMVRLHEQDPEQLTYDELLGTGFLIFFAGHETTSKALAWTLWLLAQHPEITERLVAELDQQLGDGTPSYEDLYRLDLLDRVIKESLRLFPPASFLPRVAVQETEICGFSIPQGSEVVFSPYVTHRDPEVFPEPNRFDPDRWVGFKPTPFQYLPFGARSRTCLGMAFAGMELRTVVPRVLRRFWPQSLAGTRVDIKATTVMGPSKGLPVRLASAGTQPSSAPARVEGFVREMVDLP